MLIDWFTVIAQIINFLILVFLLKRFLFAKITGAMDEREKKISSTLDDANSTKRVAAEEAERYRQMNQVLEDERNRILAEAKDEALSVRKSLIEAARAEVEDVKAEWHKSLQREKKSFLLELRGRIGKETLSLVRTVLSDLSNTGLEQRIVDVFAEKFRNMPEEKATQIRKISQTAANEIKVTTAFNLNNDQRNFIVGLLQGRIGGDVSVAFERSANNVCGIELRFPGYKIGWSVESYLDRFEKTVSGALEIMTEPSVGQNNPHI